MTREEWLQHAVEEIDAQIYNNELDLLNHAYQISVGRCGNRRRADTFQPYDGEDVKLEDFFPTTIIIDHTIKDPIEMLGVIAYECIRAFYNLKYVDKKFIAIAKKHFFDAPYTVATPTPLLKDMLINIYNTLKKKYGDWPGKPVVVYNKQKTSKKNTIKIFCPACKFEMNVSKKMFESHNNALPTCGCGSIMAADYGEEEAQEE